MQLVDISSIKTHNKYLRLGGSVEKLKKSIETVGLINPLVLNDNNELIAGGRRFTALQELGYTQALCIIAHKNALEQELISIDENLVRKDLSKVELEESFKRGRDLYEQLYPDAIKFTEEDLSTPQSLELKTELPNEKRSFIDITAEKTGLSKKVIKSAIDREEKSSKRVKDLRAHGELNASQINEIIKLPKEEQERIVDLAKDRTVKQVKELVRNINQNGLDEAINEEVNKVQLPKEYQSLKTLVTRTNKVLGKILIEEMHTESEELLNITEAINTLRVSLDQFAILTNDTNGDTPRANHQNLNDEQYHALVQDAMGPLQQTDNL